MDLFIAIGSDHAGYEFKKKIITLVKNKGCKIKDFGTYSSKSVDYPDFVHPVADAVQSKKNHLGIIICGSGNGVCMTANKHEDIRAALCWKPELASLARQHNNANILCLPARFITENESFEITEAFLNTSFEGGRHQSRVDKINV